MGKDKMKILEIIRQGDNWYDGFWILAIERPGILAGLFLFIIAIIVAALLLLSYNDINVLGVFK